MQTPGEDAKRIGAGTHIADLFVSSCNDEELEQTFQIFARSDVIALINEVGDIEKPVPLGIRLLKDVLNSEKWQPVRLGPC
ncbi:MAG: hypothetical protein Ct9H90mP16_02950 [Candidatus Poseidoniales archaeon]|nr:MAG: hypothetical protein Ct9H90mP16_02950 [Candidatus Poseidoniales archaeon]